MKIKEYFGIAASPGIVNAKALIIEEPKFNIIREGEGSSLEISHLQTSIKATQADLEKLKQITNQKLGPEQAAIFDAALGFTNDPEFIKEITALINEQDVSAAHAVQTVGDKYISFFKAMNDDYFKERALDIRDVRDRMLCHLLGENKIDLAVIDYPVIIIAHDLTPSQTIQINDNVKGIACQLGGRTSHAAIMARALEIPAVVGLGSMINNIKAGTNTYLDGLSGKLLFDLQGEALEAWRAKEKAYAVQKEQEAYFMDQPALTKDQQKVLLETNAGTLSDVKVSLKYHPQGVGLFRTEFLYMEANTFPSEESQFETYKNVLESFKTHTVVMRTLDIGGDKTLSYYKFPQELNPFLGQRAIRFCFKREDVFRSQLRALLRASAFGKLAIMFPMIATLNELFQAKKILAEEKARLEADHVAIGKYEVGMMMEIPAAAFAAEKFAPHCDFFSIGTNDLIQYTMAADRLNEKVAYLYQPLNPAILGLINHIIKAGHQANIWVGMCGELAGNLLAVPLLIGMELDAFSMSPTSLPAVKRLLASVDSTKTKPLLEKALACSTEEEVKTLVKEQIPFDYSLL